VAALESAPGGPGRRRAAGGRRRRGPPGRRRDTHRWGPPGPTLSRRRPRATSGRPDRRPRRRRWPARPRHRPDHHRNPAASPPSPRPWARPSAASSPATPTPARAALTRLRSTNTAGTVLVPDSRRPRPAPVRRPRRSGPRRRTGLQYPQHSGRRTPVALPDGARALAECVGSRVQARGGPRPTASGPPSSLTAPGAGVIGSRWPIRTSSSSPLTGTARRAGGLARGARPLAPRPAALRRHTGGRPRPPTPAAGPNGPRRGPTALDEARRGSGRRQGTRLPPGPAGRRGGRRHQASDGLAEAERKRRPREHAAALSAQAETEGQRAGRSSLAFHARRGRGRGTEPGVGPPGRHTKRSRPRPGRWPPPAGSTTSGSRPSRSAAGAGQAAGRGRGPPDPPRRGPPAGEERRGALARRATPTPTSNPGHLRAHRDPGRRARPPAGPARSGRKPPGPPPPGSTPARERATAERASRRPGAPGPGRDREAEVRTRLDAAVEDAGAISSANRRCPGVSAPTCPTHDLAARGKRSSGSWPHGGDQPAGARGVRGPERSLHAARVAAGGRQERPPRPGPDHQARSTRRSRPCSPPPTRTPSGTSPASSPPCSRELRPAPAHRGRRPAEHGHRDRSPALGQERPAAFIALGG